MKYRKAPMSERRFARIEYRNIFRGICFTEGMDGSWAGVTVNVFTPNVKRAVRDNWKYEYRLRQEWRESSE